MHNILSKALPFLTREMLKFGAHSQLSLVITSFSTLASTIAIRGLTRDGIFEYRHSTLSTGLPSTETFTIPDIPISISVHDDSDSFVQGGTYVKIALRINDDIVLELAAGYVHQMKAITWPQVHQQDPIPNHGRFRVITGTDPGTDTEIDETVPANRVWRIISFSANFVTDANAATRTVVLDITDGTDIVFRTFVSGTQIESLTRRYSFANYGEVVVAGSDGSRLGTLPNDFFLPEGFHFLTKTSNMQTGDNWAAPRIFVEEFIQTS